MFLAALAASTFAVAPPEIPSLNVCIEEMGKTLERSGDSASDVALATVEVCRIGRVTPAPGTVAAEMTPEARRSMMDLIRETARVQAVRMIVRIRACRKTPGCVSADIGLRDGAANPASK